MTKLSQSRIKRICELFRKGWSRPNVCARANISVNSFTDWWKRGNEILDKYDGDEASAKKAIHYNRTLTRIDRKMMRMQLEFVCRVAEALADVYGDLEEVVYNAAMNDETGRMGIEVLQRRRPGTWAKQLPSPVVVSTQPIKQIIVHASDAPKLLEKNYPIDVEYEDV